MNSTSNDPTKALQALFLAFPSQERTGNERELARVYLLALEGISADFVAMACKRFIAGQVERPNLTWRPSPAELAVEARRLRDKAGVDAHRHRLAAPDGVPLVRERRPNKPFIPYPKLWDALAGEPALLKALNAMTFDEMTAVSKLMATEGLEAAKTRLRDRAAMPARQQEHAA